MVRALSNPSVSRADLVALEQTNYEIRNFVGRFYDGQTGWLLRTNVPSELKAAINRLIQIDALRGKKLQEALNLWSKNTELTAQQQLVADTLQALINGYEAESASGGLDFEEVTRFNALLQQGIEAVKQSSTLVADVGIA